MFRRFFAAQPAEAATVRIRARRPGGWSLLVPLAVAAVVLANASTAVAADVRINGATLEYLAKDNEGNDAHFHEFGGTYTVYDNTASVTAGAGCTQVGPKKVTCPSAAVTSIAATLLNGWDRFDVLETQTSLRVPVSVDAGEGNDWVSAGSRDDVVVGGPGNDQLDGGKGNDRLLGGQGDDLLHGLDGDDVMVGGSGSDDHTGGTGTDTASYEDHVQPVVVDIGGAANGDGGAEDTVGAAKDTVRSDVENLIGGSAKDLLSGDGGANHLQGREGDDELSGLGAADQLEGEGGNDKLIGGDGADLLAGAGGNDQLHGNNGADQIDGGAGGDTASYVQSSVGVTATVNGTASDGDQLSTVENLTGGTAADQLTGDGNTNVLAGGAGNDTIEGGGGVDAVSGDAGQDTLSGGSDPDIISGGDDNDSISAREGFSDLISCGAGSADSAEVDAAPLDVVDPDCESVLEPLTPTDAKVFVEGSGIRYTTPLDEANDLTVALDGSDYRFTDAAAPLAAGTGCTRSGEHEVRCPVDGVNHLLLQSGLGDDHVTVEAGVTALLEGGPGHDTLQGGPLADQLEGGPGNDTIEGRGGSDSIRGGIGADHFDGGAGSLDSLDYSDHPDGIELTLDGLPNDGNASDGPSGARDVIGTGIEAYYGGPGDDVLTGSAGADWLDGAEGSDQVDGLDGDDEVYGEDGEDELDGGDGEDIISGGDGNDMLSARDGAADEVFCGTGTDGASVDLPSLDVVDPDCESVELPTSARVDVLPGAGFGTYDLVYSTAESDDNDIKVQQIADSGPFTGPLFHFDVIDTKQPLVAGALCLQITQNHVKCRPMPEGEFVLGNTVVVNAGAGDDRIENEITVPFSQSSPELQGSEGNDELLADAPANLRGGSGDDTLTVREGAVTGFTLSESLIEGGPGDDSLVGATGPDRLDGGTGADDISGGGYWDVVDYASRSESLTVVAADGLANDGGASDESNGRRDDVMGDVDGVLGGSGDDHLTMAASVARIGLVDGGAGDDVLDGGIGRDQMTGGPGYDEATYAKRTQPVTVDLQNPVFDAGESGERDQIASSVEQVTGGSGNDHLIGSGRDDRLIGGSGDDQLFGRDGDDDLVGQEGADTLDGEAGADDISGGADNDIAAGSAGADVLDLATGDDSVNGGAGDDTIDLGAGADSADGGEGDDTIAGGDQGDQLAGGDGADRIDGGEGSDSLRGGEGADELVGAGGDDALEGGFDGDILSGGSGGDGLDGGLGADALSGGAGTDHVDYSSRTAPVSSDPDDTADDGEAGEADNVAADVEGAIGGTASDRLVGNDGAGAFVGGDGADSLDGNGGADILEGGSGRDTVDYSNRSATLTLTIGDGPGDGESGEGDDLRDDVEVIVGGSGGDVISGDSDSESLNGGPGNDSIAGNGGDDQIDGGAGDDAIAGGEGKDTLGGGGGSDAIGGDGGDDSLDGLDGDDLLDGGAGADDMSGSSGNDLVTYASRTASLSVSLNSAADDGQAGEGDNVRDDVDRLILGSGDDTADTRNAEVATGVDCAAGNDTATIDAADTAANCESIKQPGARQLARPRIGIGALKLAGSTIRMTLSCPKEALGGCKGRATVRKGKLRLGSKAFTAASGKRKLVKVKLKRNARAVVRRAARLRVSVAASDSQGRLGRSAKSFRPNKRSQR